MESIKKLFWPITAPIVFIQNHFKAVLLVLVVGYLLFSGSKDGIGPEPNLYRIDLSGPILSADNFLKDVKEAEEPSVKGVLLVVNSPGGSVPPSVEMMMAIRRLRAMKPVVAYDEGTMASGSYYASSYATKIIANPGAIVGSIGVILEMPNATDLMKKVGVSMNVVKSGELKEAGAYYRPWTTKEHKELQHVTDAIYQMFVSDVAKARGLNPKNAPAFANGRIFTAHEAVQMKLADGTGSLHDAKKLLENLSGVKHPTWNEEPQMEKFLHNIGSQSRSFVQDVLANNPLQMRAF